MAIRILAIDSETDIRDPDVAAPPLVCVSASLDGQTAELIHHTDATPFLVEALRAAARKEVRLVGHNLAGYDLKIFAAHEPQLLPLIFAALDADGIQCTLINEKLIDLSVGELRGYYQEDEDGNEEWVATGYTLDEVYQRYGGQPLDKGPDSYRSRYGELRDLPLEQWPEPAIEYPKHDAIAHYEVYKAQWLKAKGIFPDLLKPAPGEARAAFALSLMTAWGLKTSAKRIDAFEAREQERMAVALASMIDAGLIRDENRNPKTGERRRTRDGQPKPAHWVRNTKITKGKVMDLLGEHAPLTKKGEDIAERQGDAEARAQGYVSTAAWVLKMTKDPDLSACVDYARAQKNLTTYVPLLRGGVHSRIHAGIDSVLDTGRVSMFKPNLQNLPRLPGARECFVPDAGNLYSSTDLDVAEIRAFAQIQLWTTGHSVLAELFQNDPDADPHTILGGDLAGISEAEALALKKAKDAAFKKGPRQRAKVGNFGFQGGMGGEKLAANERKKFYESDGHDGVDMTTEEGEQLRAAWKRRWDAKPYFDWVTNQLGPAGLGTFRCFGSGRYAGGRRFTQGANLGFQALIAWIMKVATYEVSRRCYVIKSSPLYGSRVVNFKHDELICEHPEAKAPAAAEEVARIMCETGRRFMPDIPVTASPALMRYWAKGAEPVYKDGKLAVWEGEDPLGGVGLEAARGAA